MLVVLAAGRGRRLGAVTDTTPKPLVDLGDGSSFLTRLLRQHSRIRPAEAMVVCAGYRLELVEEHVRRVSGAQSASVVYNPYFSEAGPIATLWVAREVIAHNDFIVCNADTYYDDSIVEAMTQRPNGIELGVDSSCDPYPDSLKVRLDGDGLAIRVGKGIPITDWSAISIGMLSVRGPAARAHFVAAVEARVRERDGSWSVSAWHDLLNTVREDGASVRSYDVSGLYWSEVDTEEELSLLRSRLLRRTVDGQMWSTSEGMSP